MMFEIEIVLFSAQEYSRICISSRIVITTLSNLGVVCAVM